MRRRWRIRWRIAFHAASRRACWQRARQGKAGAGRQVGTASSSPYLISVKGVRGVYRATIFRKDVETPFTELRPQPILSIPRDESLPCEGFRSADNLEKKNHEGVDGKEKRYRMGGSPRDEMFRGRNRKGSQVIDL